MTLDKTALQKQAHHGTIKFTSMQEKYAAKFMSSAQMDGWMDGWMHRYMDECIHGWLVGYIH